MWERKRRHPWNHDKNGRTEGMDVCRRVRRTIDATATRDGKELLETPATNRLTNRELIRVKRCGRRNGHSEHAYDARAT